MNIYKQGVLVFQFYSKYFKITGSVENGVHAFIMPESLLWSVCWCFHTGRRIHGTEANPPIGTFSYSRYFEVCTITISYTVLFIVNLNGITWYQQSFNHWDLGLSLLNASLHVKWIADTHKWRHLPQHNYCVPGAWKQANLQVYILSLNSNNPFWKSLGDG